MSYTKCQLYVDACEADEININDKQHEEFCFKPKHVYHDGLGMTSTGKLVIPADGDYRITATANITGGSAYDYIHFGFDELLGDEGAGRYNHYSSTSIRCDSTGKGNEIFGNVSDVATFKAGQVIGCIYLRGSQNLTNIVACRPMMTIEKIG